jgi:hypothetical protein
MQQTFKKCETLKQYCHTLYLVGLEQLMNVIVYFTHPAQFHASVLALEPQPSMFKIEAARQQVK